MNNTFHNYSGTNTLWRCIDLNQSHQAKTRGLPSALRSLMYSRIGSRTGSLRSGVSSMSVRRVWDPSMSRTHFLSVSSWRDRRKERKKFSYPMQGDKSEVLPSAFTEVSGIDVLPCLPIEQWASPISLSSSRVRAISGLEERKGLVNRLLPSPHGSPHKWIQAEIDVTGCVMHAVPLYTKGRAYIVLAADH